MCVEECKRSSCIAITLVVSFVVAEPSQFDCPALVSSPFSCAERALTNVYVDECERLNNNSNEHTKKKENICDERWTYTNLIPFNLFLNL